MGVAGTVRELACVHLLPLDEPDSGALGSGGRADPYVGGVIPLMRQYDGFDAESRHRAYAIALRRLALQLLYLLDAVADRAASDDATVQPGTENSGATCGAEPDLDRDASDVLAELDEVPGLGPIGRDRVECLVRGAWAQRARADEAVHRLAPGWPASRQPAIDRALLRLAWYEIHAEITPARVVANEAVELAKRFSTDKSPAFINGVLGRLIREHEQSARSQASGAGPGPSQEE